MYGQRYRGWGRGGYQIVSSGTKEKGKTEKAAEPS